MRLLMRIHLTTLAIIVLALFAGSGVGRAQNNEPLNKATNGTPNGLEQSGSRQTPDNSLQDEIAKMLRLQYDAFTKLDATLIGNFTDNGFVSVEGKMLSSMLVKARVREDFASTPASDNYHFEIEDLKVFQPDAGTAVANYRLTSTPSNKQLTTTVDNITDIFVRRDGRWLIFAEHCLIVPKRLKRSSPVYHPAGNGRYIMGRIFIGFMWILKLSMVVRPAHRLNSIAALINIHGPR